MKVSLLKGQDDSELYSEYTLAYDSYECQLANEF